MSQLQPGNVSDGRRSHGEVWPHARNGRCVEQGASVGDTFDDRQGNRS